MSFTRVYILYIYIYIYITGTGTNEFSTNESSIGYNTNTIYRASALLFVLASASQHQRSSGFVHQGLERADATAETFIEYTGERAIYKKHKGKETSVAH